MNLSNRVPLQAVSQEIWDKKYRLKDYQGEPVDKDVSATFHRVAKSLASVEEDPQRWYKRFLWALENGAIPAGRILSNIGADGYKPGTSTINCTVSGVIYDSMDSIMNRVTEAALTLKAGCGIGYDFSTLRPKGASVKGVGATTSGPIPFMDVYDKMCFTVSSAGGRRGAQMGVLDVQHPDIIDFIKAKREDGRLRQFNLSILITDNFMQAVEKDENWPLVFPYRNKEEYQQDKAKAFWRRWPKGSETYYTNSNGDVACKVYKYVKARELWDLIMQSTYDYAEPGFILIDKVNQENNNWWCEDIRTTNPCGEQPLPPYGSCLLGSVNLTAMLDVGENNEITFNYDRYSEVISVFTRMLDNVVEMNGLPLSQQREEIHNKRRHGMGFLGLGSTLALLGLRYGSPEACQFAERISQILAFRGWEQGAILAKEKGCAPIMADYRSGAHEKWLSSGYMKRICKQWPELGALLSKCGTRFTHHSSIAPTGTISLAMANNASNGIEPTFAHEYIRNVIVPGKNTKEAVTVYSFERLAWKTLYGDSRPEPESFVTTDDITPMEHVAMQAAVQPWVDSSISKTINVPTDIKFEDFKNVYMEAWKRGLKGCTTFRFNPEAFQGVLVKEDDLKNTVYEFVTESGETVAVKGNEMVEYAGQTQTAANLFDALKEGFFGRL